MPSSSVPVRAGIRPHRSTEPNARRICLVRLPRGRPTTRRSVLRQPPANLRRAAELAVGQTALHPQATELYAPQELELQSSAIAGALSR